jgi:predicted DNA-binding protein
MRRLVAVMRPIPVTHQPVDQIARTRTEEVAMSTPDTSPNRNGGVKTLAIRLEPDLHAQLSLIAQLRASTITDEIRQAIEAHIVVAKTAPELAERADTALEDIERDAAARREAIATLFGGDQPTAPATTSGRSRNRQASNEPEPSGS